MASPSRNARVFWTAAATVVVLDVVTKMAAARLLIPRHVPHRVVGDVVRFTLAYNPGAAFSMSLGDYSRYIFGAFALIALVILWRLYRGSRAGDVARVLALGLAWGGAAGNLIDRIVSPMGVVDFIDIGFREVRFWTFNVADSAVTVGAFLLAWVLWREDRAEERALLAGRSVGDATESSHGSAELSPRSSGDVMQKRDGGGRERSAREISGT